ncbi:unnamed protein product [Adineta steineri]|uniref:G-protein coupled receptors family 1 profile domain-containing protein n=1 Tax=Adineta steineri TaxID=433720 RepID=A0A819VZY5_9BILA|nr:unnamed protein product [Adineta steineri]CAF4115960.1 unnamed protein product [Adineta steineri]
MIMDNNFQSWFIPFDVFNLICHSLVIIFTFIFLFIIIGDKTCHTVPMLLVANSCLAELVFSSNLFWMAIFTLNNDLKRQQYEDSLCVFRGYIIYITCYIQNCSYFLQAIYRYITVVYSARLFWQSARFQFFLISLMWTSAVIFTLPHILTNQVIYLVDDQICEMPSQRSFISIYNVTWFYMIPMSSIILIYVKLVRYVKHMSKHVTPVNTLIRAQRELKMVYRIVILVPFLIGLGIPYASFVVIGFFTSPPKYHFRIAYIFVNISLIFIMMSLFKFTDPVRTSVMKIINAVVEIVR